MARKRFSRLDSSLDEGGILLVSKPAIHKLAEHIFKLSTQTSRYISVERELRGMRRCHTMIRVTNSNMDREEGKN